MSSIREESQTYESIFNDFRLNIRHPQGKKKLVFLEGVSDVRILRNFINSEDIHLQDSDGKKNVIDYLNATPNDLLGKVFGIRDADFIHMNSNLAVNLPLNLFLTDYHDMEIMMINSEAFEKIINEIFTTAKNSVSTSNTLYLKDFILDAIKSIGLLRYINEINEFNLKFKRIDVAQYIICSSGRIEIEIEKMCEDLIERSGNANINLENLLEIYQTYDIASFEANQICCGHDFSKAVTTYFKSSDDYQGTNFSHETFEKDLRLSYTLEMFKMTNLYHDLNSRGLCA